MNNSLEQGNASSLSNTNNPQSLNRSSLISQTPTSVQNSVQNSLLDNPTTNLVVQSSGSQQALAPYTSSKVKNIVVSHPKNINYPFLVISILFILIAISLYSYNRKKNQQNFY